MAAPEPLPTAEEADRFFTEVPPARSAVRAATAGPRPAPAPPSKAAPPVPTPGAWSGRLTPWATPGPRRVGAALAVGGVVLAAAFLVDQVQRTAQPSTSRAVPSTVPSAAPVAPAATASADPAADDTVYRKRFIGDVDVELGTCFESLPASAMNFVTVLPCGDPEAQYVLRAEFPLTQDPSVDAQAPAVQTETLCRDFLADGGPDPDVYTYAIVVPDADEWDEGYTSGYCLVRLPPLEESGP